MKFLFVLAIIAVIAVAVQRSLMRRRREVWSEAARRLGFRFEPGALLDPPRLSGELDGNRIVVESYVRSYGNSSKRFTRYRVFYPRPLDLGLRLTRQGFFSGLAGLFGSQDIEVGDASFDDKVTVKGHDPARVAAFLTPSRRLRIHRVLDSFDGCVVEDQGVFWDRKGFETDVDRMVKTIRHLSRTAYHLVQDEDRTLDEAMDARQAGELVRALDLVREAKAKETQESPDVAALEGEILYAGGRYGEAAAAFSEATKALPEGSETASWAERAREKSGSGPEAPPAETPPGAPAAEPSPAGEASGLLADADAFCRELFEELESSFQSNRRFEEELQGKEVSWTGVLKSADTFSFDLVFGDRGGVKAVFEIATITKGLYSGRPVQAVVEFPAAEAERLRKRIGKKLGFTGTLKSLDALMRNVFVAGGSLGPES